MDLKKIFVFEFFEFLKIEKNGKNFDEIYTLKIKFFNYLKFQIVFL